MRTSLRHKRISGDDEQRFWQRIIKNSSDECWQWDGCKNAFGYGTIRAEGKTFLAHRFSFKLAHGKLPNGLCICHTCDNPECCNPKHLFAATHDDNMKDRKRKGHYRDIHGENHPRARLTKQDVNAIRTIFSAGNITKTELAKRYGVSITHIGYIISNKSWNHEACDA